MKRVVYYVASSVDGFIATKEGGIEGFVNDDEFNKYYYKELEEFGTVVMGKNTYEFGYQFGLKPGDKAYKHMDHYIFSKSIELPQNSNVSVVEKNWIEKLKELKDASLTDIYLCGGGQFAGFLVENNLIDVIRLKINPFIMGKGIPILHTNKILNLKLFDTKTFECGIVENTYEVIL